MKQISCLRKKWLLFLIALILLSLGSIYALREVLIAPRLADWLTDFMEAKLDLTVSIDRIHGTYFTGITIENLTTTRPSSRSPLSSVDLKKLTLTYSLFSLFGGLTNFLATSTIDIQMADVTLELDHFSDYPDEQSDQPFQLPSGLPPATLIPVIRVQRSSLTLLKKHDSSVLKRIDFTLKKNGPEKARLDLAVGDWRWHVEDVSKGSAPMAMKVTYDEKELMIEKLSVGEDGVKISAKVGLTDLPQSVPFALTSLIAGAPLEVEGHLRSDALEGQFRAEQLNVEALTASQTFPSVPAKGSLSFAGKGRLPFNRSQEVEGKVRLDIEDGYFNGLSAESLQADVSVENQSFHVQRLNLMSAENQVSFTEMDFPMSLFTVSSAQEAWVSLDGTFQLDLQDLPAVLDMIERDLPYKAAETQKHRLRLDGQIRNGGSVVVQGDLAIAGSSIQLKSSQFALPTDDSSLLNTRVDARMNLDIKDLSLLNNIFPIPALGGQLLGDVLIRGSFADPRGSIRMEGRKLQYMGHSIGSVSAQINGDGRRINAEKLNFSNGNDLLNMSGVYRIDSKTFEKVHAAFQFEEVQTYLHPWLDAQSPFRGDLKGIITAGGPLLAPRGQLDISSKKSQMGGFTLSDTLLKASLQGRQLLIEHAETHTSEGLLHFAGLVQADEAFKIFQGQLTDVLMRWRGDDLRLMAPVRFQYSRPGTVDLADLKLNGSMGELRMNGRLSLNKDSDLSFRVSHLSSRGWLAEILNQELAFDGLEAEGTVQGTFASPKVDLTGSIRSLRSEHIPSPLLGQFQISYAKDGLRIRRFDWSGEGGFLIKATGLLPILYTDKITLIDSALSLDAEVQLAELKWLNLILKKELIAGGSAHLKLKMSGTGKRPLGTLTLKTKDMDFNSGQAPLPPGPSEIDAILQYDRGEISINTLKLQAPTLLFTAKGAWRNGPTLEMLWPSTDHVLSGEIEFSGNTAVSELSWLASGVPAIRRINGRLNAVFNVQGPIRKPTTSAKISLQDGELRLQTDFPTMKEMQVQAVATPDAIEIQQCTAQLGGESVHLEGRMTSITTSTPFVNVHVWGENLLLYRSQELRMRADTDVTLEGPVQKLRLNGKVTVTEGRLSQYIDVLGGLQGGRVPQTGKGVRLFSIRKPPFRDMGLSVQITAKNAFDIRNNFIRGKLRPDLQLTGTGEAPILIGKVIVDTARLRLPSGNLVIENGLVQFLETNPDRPVLNLIGSTRMLGYDISVIVEGPYDEPQITLTSSPPLPNEDLLMLVLTGTPPPATGRAVDKRSRNLNVAVYVGRDLLARWFSGENSNSTESILDRFEAEMGRDITRQGEETLEARFRLIKGLFQEKDTLYITGERDVFDYYNAGLRIVFRFR